MEHCDALYTGGPVFYYNDTLFKPSTDSFLLGAFASPKRGDTVCDLGAGTGILGCLLFARQPELTLHQVEINPASLAYARKTMEANHWSGRCVFYEGDLRDRNHLPDAGSMDVVLSNPPYFQPGTGYSAPEQSRQTARETGCDVTDMITQASYLLRWGGTYYLVFRPERLTDVLISCRSKGLEPKRLAFVQHRPSALPSLFLLGCRRGGKPGLSLERNWILEEEDGTPTALSNHIYFREEGS